MVYVNRFTDPLPHYCGPEEGEEGGEGRVEKNGGGGQNWKKGKRGKFCARRFKKRGGGDKGWEIQVYNAYHFKRNEKYSDPLNSPKLFLWFCFSWLYLTHLELKKMFTYFFIFLNKRVHILYKFGNARLCTSILKNIQEEDPQIPPFFHLYLLSKGVL